MNRSSGDEKKEPNAVRKMSGSQDRASFVGKISDIKVKWRNWMVMHKGVKEVAKEIGEFGKTVDISVAESEEAVVKHLEELEKWDRVALGEVVLEEASSHSQ